MAAHLVVGLGNPGAAYAGTRHNVGWRILDVLEARAKTAVAERGANYAVCRCEIEVGELILLRPLTYMNRSGEALAQWRHDHPEGWTDLLVVTDDVYLPLGTLRLRPAGSSGGHRGLESLEAGLGREFARLRLGVGAPAGAAALREHVLEAFTPDERATVETMIERAADAVVCWSGSGITVAMNRFNSRVTKEASEA